MNARDYMEARDKFTESVSAQFGSRQEQINDELAGLESIHQVRRRISNLRADNITITYFVEEEGAEEQVRDALEFFADKLEFRGNVVKGRKPSSNGKEYYFVQAQPRNSLVEDISFFDEEGGGEAV